MKIAVLSGKGGTGKTFLSVNLSEVMENGTYVDCDVEEPNGHLFLKPHFDKIKDVTKLVPSFDGEKCTGCRKCIAECRFGALAFLKGKPALFEDVCHSCGVCNHVCEYDAVVEVESKIGEIRSGKSEGTCVIAGFMNPGQASGVPIIHEMTEMTKGIQNVVMDGPPGSSCLVMETIRDADFCLIVAEPSLYGLENLKLVAELTGIMKKPAAVVINKASFARYEPLYDYCRSNDLEVIASIPYDSELGRITSNGLIAARENYSYREMFTEVINEIRRKIS